MESPYLIKLTHWVMYMGIDVENIAVEAHEMALLAAKGLESHEIICSERYSGIHSALNKITAFQESHSREEDKNWRSFYNRLWGVAGVVIMLLLGVLGTMSWYIITGKT